MAANNIRFLFMFISFIIYIISFIRADAPDSTSERIWMLYQN